MWDFELDYCCQLLYENFLVPLWNFGEYDVAVIVVQNIIFVM